MSEITKAGKTPRLKQPEVDRGWAWVVLVTGFLCFGMVLGQMLSFSAYFVIFLDVFQESRSYTAAVGSISMGVVQIGGITNGFFKSKLGARNTTILGAFLSAFGYLISSYATSILQLVFYYGIVASFGLAMCFGGIMNAVSQRFERHLSLATGFFITGGGFGIMLFPRLIEWQVDVYGWRGSLFLQSAISLQMVILGSLFFPLTPGNELETAPEKESDDKLPRHSHFTDPRAVVYSAAIFLQGLGLFTLYVIYEDFTIVKNFKSDYPLTILAVGIGNIVGRFVPSLLSNRLPPLLHHVLLSAMLAAIMFGNYYNDNRELFIFLGALFGYGQGSFMTVTALVVADMFGQEDVAANYGYMLFYSGLGSLVGPPLSGYMMDATGSYFGCFMMSGSVFSAATCLLIVTFFLNRALKFRSDPSIKQTIPISSQ